LTHTKKNNMKVNIISGRKLLIAIPIIGAGICCSVFFNSCTRNNPDSSGVEYMPDMYRSPSYEDNSKNPLFPDSMTDRLPVAGTIPVGFTPDPYPNAPDGWKYASENLKDPFPATPEIIQKVKLSLKYFVSIAMVLPVWATDLLQVNCLALLLHTQALHLRTLPKAKCTRQLNTVKALWVHMPAS